MNKYIIFLCFFGLYTPYAVASFSAAAAAGVGAGQGAAQPADSPLAKLYAKQKAENKLESWQSIAAKLLPIRLVPSKTLKHSHEVRYLAWNGDGTQIASCSGISIFTWNVQSGALLRTLNTAGAKFLLTELPNKNHETYSSPPPSPTMVRNVAWNHYNNTLACIVTGEGNNNNTYIFFWDPEIGQPLTACRLYEDRVNRFDWNHNGTRLVIVAQANTWKHKPSGLVEPETLHTKALSWRTVDNQVLEFKCDREENSMTVNHDGTCFAYGDKKNIVIINLENLTTHKPAHQARILKIKWSHDDAYLATYSEDRTVCIWSAGNGAKLHTLNHQGKKHGMPIAWSGDDTRLVTASCDDNPRSSAKDLFVWNTKNGTLLHMLSHPVTVQEVLWHPDGRHIIAQELFDSSNTARIWDSQTGAELHALQEPGWIWKIAWSRDGTRLATGDHGVKRLSKSQPVTKADYCSAHIWNTAHMIDPKYQVEHNQLKAGILAAEQLMLVHVFNQFPQQENNVHVSLKAIAGHTQTPGISTAELARVLSTFHPVIMNGILAGYNVSIQRDNLQEEYSYKALQEIMKHIKARDEVIKKAYAQENPGAAKLPKPQAIETAFEEYLDATPENYLDAYKAWKETQQVVPLSKPVNQILEEYIVDEHPIIEQANGTKHE